MSRYENTEKTFALDRFEHANIVAALIHYALAVAVPDECINCLEKLCPEPKRPWREMIEESRSKQRELMRTADDEAWWGEERREAAAMRER